MKQVSIIKQYILGLTLISTMIFQGCGGGNTPTNGNPSGDTPIVDKPIGGETGEYKYNKVTIAGSSITWGQGYLGEKAYLGEVEKYLRDKVATTIIPTNGTPINDAMSYKGKLYKFTGAGTEISGIIRGDEISIAYAKERGNAGATVEMFIDGVRQDTFSTKGEDIQSSVTNIEGDGEKVAFDLGRAHTFDHNVPQQYGTGSINTVECGDSVVNNGWMIIRKEVGKAIHHFIVFKNAPNGNFDISYKYGENIKPVKSSVDNIEQSIESTLESTCGEKYSERTPPIPDQSLDFRQTDERAVKTWGKLDYKDHNFTLKIKEGGSEEFILNFITNHMYYFQNAGISGATAEDLDPNLSYNERNPNLRTTEQIIAFEPDLFILESSTNDALTWAREQAGEIGTNEWIVQNDNCTPYANKIIFTSTDSTPQKGDIIVIGRYNNNIDNIAVRIIDSWNSSTKTATFTKSLTSNDFNGNSCQIKRITKWENNVKKVVDKVIEDVGNTLKVGIATSGVPDLNDRKLMGYREKAEIMANDNGWMFFDFFQKTYDWKVANPGSQWSYGGDDTHPNAEGIVLFGVAITDVLKDQ